MLEIEFKVVAQTMHSGVTHERCADFRHGKKTQKRGEFITPPRPTGRRSNELISKEVSRAKLEYMNIHPPISVLATALVFTFDVCPHLIFFVILKCTFSKSMVFESQNAQFLPYLVLSTSTNINIVVWS